jgi:hypothetical protein
MSRISRGHVAVFARNHRQYLDEAVALCRQNPQRPVTFRAAGVWRSAEGAVSGGATPVPIYIAAVGGAGIEYVGELCEVQTHPFRGDTQTEHLLELVTPSTKQEGLWERGPRPVRTLYAIKGCRKLRTPVRLSTLSKAADGTQLDDGYQHGYALVQPTKLN